LSNVRLLLVEERGRIDARVLIVIIWVLMRNSHCEEPPLTP